MIDDATPILIGQGQKTVRGEPLDALSTPLDLMLSAASLACEDAELLSSSLQNLSDLVVVKSFREPMRNTPRVLAEGLGASQARCWLTPDGGNAPQYLVNHYAQAIALGESQLVLLAGAEAIDNARRLIKDGQKPNWSIPTKDDAQYLYDDRPMVTPQERAHGIWAASSVYPLFENALRGFYGHSIEAHQLEMGKLFSKFSSVAAKSEYAWFPVERSAHEIATATEKNRYVGWPYTKFMNAMNQINQSAALLLTSVGHARKMGVPESRWVYLHGCADTTEKWFISERVSYHSSKAIEVMGRQATAMADLAIEDIDYVDIYSCFPSAVAVSRDALGINRDDTRSLTVTGGLPFHGGAGNNYSMNAIATMMEVVRTNAGRWGMVTANGGYLSKHSAGIYSTAPPNDAHKWMRESPATYQPIIDEQVSPSFVTVPSGPAHIETYTVTFGRDGAPQRGIVIGRLGLDDDPTASRFIANTPNDVGLLMDMTRTDFLGAKGRVQTGGEVNIFTPS